MNTINSLKEKITNLNNKTTEIKTITSSITNNLYTTLIQMNFSIKVIVQFYSYINKYIDSEQNVSSILNSNLDAEQNGETVNFSLYELVGFNKEFVTGVTNLENFSKLLLESISNHLVRSIDDTPVELKTIYKNYCDSNRLVNEWDTFNFFAKKIVSEKYPLFNIQVNENSNHENEKTLFEEFNNYKSILESIIKVFDLDETVNATKVIPYIEDTIDYLNDIINFRNSSPIYRNYLFALNNVFDQTYYLFDRLSVLISSLVEEASNYEVLFKDNNYNVDTLLTALTTAQDLISSLKLTYPTIDSLDALLNNDDYLTVIGTVENIYRQELRNLDSLLSTAIRDYKLIKSIESFMYSNPTIKNSVLFNIMDNLDKSLSEIEVNNAVEESSTFKSLTFIPIKFFNTVSATNLEPFGKDSFNHKIYKLDLLTEPFYDAFNYYRMLLYKLKHDKKYIFDMLETFDTYNKNITNDDFNLFMEDFYNIRIDQVDYLNIDSSKLNPSIVSKYSYLKVLDLYTIEKHVDAIAGTNLAEIKDHDDLYNFVSTLPYFNLIHFQITEFLLYNNLDIELLVTSLKKRTSYKDSLYLILFAVSINYIIKQIEADYIENDVLDIPIGNDKYNYLLDNFISVEIALEEMAHIKHLVGIKKIYEGKEENGIFDHDMIENFDEPENSVWINKPEVIKDLKDLFASFLKEV